MCPLRSTPTSSPARVGLWVPNQGAEESGSRGLVLLTDRAGAAPQKPIAVWVNNLRSPTILGLATPNGGGGCCLGPCGVLLWVWVGAVIYDCAS